MIDTEFLEKMGFNLDDKAYWDGNGKLEYRSGWCRLINQNKGGNYGRNDNYLIIEDGLITDMLYFGDGSASIKTKTYKDTHELMEIVISLL